MNKLIHYKSLYNNSLVTLNTKYSGNKLKDAKLRKEKQNANEIMKEFKYLSNIETLENMHGFLRTNKFWADAWAIGLIEQKLNFKFIILSEEKYKDKDFKNILQCGDMSYSNNEPLCKICNIKKSEYEYILENVSDSRQLRELSSKYIESHGLKILPDSELKKLLKDCDHKWLDPIEDNSDYNPKAYIILTYSGNHYRLVTYKNNTLFKTFNELPREIKELVQKKCNNVGLYKRIPEIKSKKKIGKGKQLNKVKINSKKKKKNFFSFLFN